MEDEANRMKEEAEREKTKKEEARLESIKSWNSKIRALGTWNTDFDVKKEDLLDALVMLRTKIRGMLSPPYFVRSQKAMRHKAKRFNT